jgi:hypothetical protein
MTVEGTCGDTPDYCSSGYSFGLLYASGFLSGCIIVGSYAILLLENRGNVFSYYLNILSNSRRAIIYERSSSKAKLRSKQKKQQAANMRGDNEKHDSLHSASIELSEDVGNNDNENAAPMKEEDAVPESKHEIMLSMGSEDTVSKV